MKKKSVRLNIPLIHPVIRLFNYKTISQFTIKGRGTFLKLRCEKTIIAERPRPEGYTEDIMTHSSPIKNQRLILYSRIIAACSLIFVHFNSSHNLDWLARSCLTGCLTDLKVFVSLTTFDEKCRKNRLVKILYFLLRVKSYFIRYTA